jgi:hypothetical protein
MMLVSAALIFVAARVLEPELPSGACVDLRDHFSRVRLPLFAVLSVFWLFPIIGRLLYADGHILDRVSVGRLAFLGLSLSGACVRSPVWHGVLAIAWAALLATTLVFLRSELA